MERGDERRVEALGALTRRKEKEREEKNSTEK